MIDFNCTIYLYRAMKVKLFLNRRQNKKKILVPVAPDDLSRNLRFKFGLF